MSFSASSAVSSPSNLYFADLQQLHTMCAYIDIDSASQMNKLKTVADRVFQAISKKNQQNFEALSKTVFKLSQALPWNKSKVSRDEMLGKIIDVVTEIAASDILKLPAPSFVSSSSSSSSATPHIALDVNPFGLPPASAPAPAKAPTKVEEDAETQFTIIDMLLEDQGHHAAMLHAISIENPTLSERCQDKVNKYLEKQLSERFALQSLADEAEQKALASKFSGGGGGGGGGGGIGGSLGGIGLASGEFPQRVSSFTGQSDSNILPSGFDASLIDNAVAKLPDDISKIGYLAQFLTQLEEIRSHILKSIEKLSSQNSGKISSQALGMNFSSSASAASSSAASLGRSPSTLSSVGRSSNFLSSSSSSALASSSTSSLASSALASATSSSPSPSSASSMSSSSASVISSPSPSSSSSFSSSSSSSSSLSFSPSKNG